MTSFTPPHTSGHLRTITLMVAFLFTALLGGCATSHQLQVDRQGHPVYQNLELKCQFRRELNHLAILPAESEITQTAGSGIIPPEEELLDGITHTLSGTEASWKSFVPP
ncbi:MAG: hypothetical protein R3C11_07920 [Planctomycetaceae bacterium]